MQQFFRLQEYKVMFYRLLLAYLFYSLSRFLFFIYNYSFLEIDTLFEYLKLSYHGLTFDTAAILDIQIAYQFLKKNNCK